MKKEIVDKASGMHFERQKDHTYKLTNVDNPDETFIVPDIVNKNPVAAIDINRNADLSNVRILRIGASIKDISDHALSLFNSIECYEVSAENPFYASIDGVIYSSDKKTIIKYPKARKEATFFVPEGVERIDSNAFSGAVNLSHVHSEGSITDIGESAFSECENLVSIDLGTEIQKIESFAFFSCTKLCNIGNISNVKEIGTFAFYKCESLQEFRVPPNVTEISDNMFCGCAALSTVMLHKNVKCIGDSAFMYCSKLKKLEGYSKKMKIEGYNTFAFCESLCEIPMCKYAEKTINICMFQGCEALETVSIPQGVSDISAGAFANCASLRRIDLPKSITHIGQRAFENCEQLQELVFEDSVRFKTFYFVHYKGTGEDPKLNARLAIEDCVNEEWCILHEGDDYYDSILND